MGRKYTTAQAKASGKYDKKFEKIFIRLDGETKKRFKTAADEAGKSLNRFIIDTVKKEVGQ